jgi:hypothetical protein
LARASGARISPGSLFRAKTKNPHQKIFWCGFVGPLGALLSYHSAPRPKTLTSVRVIIPPRVVVAMRAVVLVVWVFIIGVFILQRGGGSFITIAAFDCQQINSDGLRVLPLNHAPDAPATLIDYLTIHFAYSLLFV